MPSHPKEDGHLTACSALRTLPAVADTTVDVYPRPGFGDQHPSAAEFLARHQPLTEGQFEWPNGSVVVARAFDVADELPTEVVQSVRCLVFTDDEHVVLCENIRGVRHVWPGGRREPGETFAQTACREVLEETGWLVGPASLTQVGWLHYEAGPHRGPEIPWPHPDIFHALFVGRASSREAEDWTDTEGYELSSRLISPDEVMSALTPGDVATPLLEALFARLTASTGVSTPDHAPLAEHPSSVGMPAQIHGIAALGRT